MRISIAMALCLLSRQVFAEQIPLRCHGYSIELDDASKQPFTFTVTIDPDRNLVMDIGASDSVATPNTSNGSIVETIQFSETTISANQQVWHHQEKDHLAAPPAGEKRLKIDRVTGDFDLRISNENLNYVKGTCEAWREGLSGRPVASRRLTEWLNRVTTWPSCIVHSRMR
jgi:hypothetical protein